MNPIILIHIINMKYRNFLNILLLLLISFTINSQDHSIHKKWKLDGADERIEKNRKGDVVLEFVLDAKINKRSKFNYFGFHISNPLLVTLRNFFLQRLVKNKNFIQSYLGKIYK